MYNLITIIISIFFVFFLGCSEKNKEQPIICDKDTIFLKPDVSNHASDIGKIHTKETTVLLKQQHHDSIAHAKETFRLKMLEKQQVTEFKKTIFSQSIDLNFDKNQDLIIISTIATDTDTITYLSFYFHLEGKMKNTYDYRFEDKIDKIKDIRTFNDSTFVISAVLTKQKKFIQKRFKYINDYNFSLIN